MLKKIILIVAVLLGSTLLISGIYLYSGEKVIKTVHVKNGKEEVENIEIYLPKRYYRQADNYNLNISDFMLEKYGDNYADIMREHNPNLESQINAIYDSYYLPSEDARVKFEPKKKSKFTYIKEREGNQIDKLELYTQILKALSADNAVVLPNQHKLAPLVTETMLKANTKQLSTFSTSYSFSSEGRAFNVEHGARKIDGLRIPNGGFFSFNEIVGKRTAENGFKDAPIIENGEYVNGLGGGVCQLSTTLYNAVIRAGLEITYASQHSLRVSYVNPSFDAMVSSDNDFIFHNTSGQEIFVEAITTDDKQLTFTIYGKPIDYKITTEYEVIKTLPRDKDVSLDTSLSPYEEVVDKKGKDGLISKGYLIYSKDGKQLSRKLIREDSYAIEPQKVRMGEGSYLEYIDEQAKTPKKVA